MKLATLPPGFRGRHGLLFLGTAALLLSGCSAPASSSSSTSQQIQASSIPLPLTTLPQATVPRTIAPDPQGPLPASDFGVQRTPCSYQAMGGSVALPDSNCTPGARNPSVTQANIGSTICVPGFSSSIRPPQSISYPEKRAAMSAYGQFASTRDYEYDHLVSLEVGGAVNAASNLWPEPYSGPYGARIKDRLENRLHQLICDRSISLSSAQAAESSDWVAAYKIYVGPLP